MGDFGDFVGAVGIGLICLFYLLVIISDMRKEGGIAVWVWGFFLASAATFALAGKTGSVLLFILGLVFLLLALMPFGSL